jgi:phospholipid N-methyltransferase
MNPHLIHLINGYITSHCLVTANTLNLFDLICKKNRGLDELCDLVKTNQRDKLEVLLHALCEIKVIDFSDQSQYCANQLTFELSDRSLHYPWLLDLINEQYFPAFSNYAESLKDTKTAFELTFQLKPWEFRSIHSKSQDTFQRWLDIETSVNAQAIITEWPWHKYDSIIDIGAGQGSLAQALIEEHQNTNVSIFDTPEVIQSLLSRLSNAHQLTQVIAGDFFKDIPKGFDAYILKSVLHDWNDEKSIQILNKIRGSLGQQGRIIIIERSLRKDFSGDPLNLNNSHLNVMMSAIHGAKERSNDAFIELFTRAKLKPLREKMLSNGYSIFELTQVS